MYKCNNKYTYEDRDQSWISNIYKNIMLIKIIEIVIIIIKEVIMIIMIIIITEMIIVKITIIITSTKITMMMWHQKIYKNNKNVDNKSKIQNKQSQTR